MNFEDKMAFNSSHSSMNGKIKRHVDKNNHSNRYHNFFSLPYRFDVDAFDNGRSIGIQIEQSEKVN